MEIYDIKDECDSYLLHEGKLLRYYTIKDIRYVKERVWLRNYRTYFEFEETDKKLYFNTVIIDFGTIDLLSPMFTIICIKLGIPKVKIHNYRIVNKEDFIGKKLLMVDFEMYNIDFENAYPTEYLGPFF